MVFILLMCCSITFSILLSKLIPENPFIITDEKENTSLDITLKPCCMAYLDVDPEPQHPSIKESLFHFFLGINSDRVLKIHSFNFVFDPI